MNHGLRPLQTALAVLACTGVAGCPPPAVDPDAGLQTCSNSTECPEGMVCHLAQCVSAVPESDAGIPDGGSTDGATVVDAGPTCHCTGRQTCVVADLSCTEPPICLEDLDCLAPRVCVRGACGERPECRTDGECQQGYCDPQRNVCIPTHCTEDRHCTNNQVCILEPDGNGGTLPGVCFPCREQAQCTGSQVCQDHQCVEPAQCTRNEDCLAPRKCDQGACVEPDCAALSANCPSGPFCDAYEPNNTVAQAKEASAGQYAFTVCKAELDLFKIPVTLGDGLFIRVEPQAPTSGSVDLRLINDNQDILIGGVQDAHGVTLVYDSAAVTPVYAWMYSGADILRASMTIQVIAGGTCRIDRMEPNNVQSMASAVLPSELGDGEAYEWSLCAGDEDWLTGAVPAGKTLEVTVLTESGPPPRVKLYNAESMQLVLQDESDETTKILAQSGLDTFLVHLSPAVATPHPNGVIVFHVAQP